MDMSYIHSILCLGLMIVHATYAGIWYNWGDWSECSLSCDGGLANRRRLCFGGNCIGSNIQYKLCNTQTCISNNVMPEYDACRSQNGKPFNGGSYSWVPRQKYQCSVYCVEENDHIPDLINIKLIDGTKCSRQSNHYCLNGKCVRLGCDGIVNSNKSVDDCGICGGDGSYCKKGMAKDNISFYKWDVQWTFCSVSCGTGFQTSSLRCRDSKNGQTVPNFLCDYNSKPSDNIRECSLKSCDPQWKTSSWESCSVGCGGGVQKRKVVCVQGTGRSKMVNLPDYRCPDPIPPSRRPCNTQFCPSTWRTGQWTQCSVTCGVGIQGRPVYCMKSFVRGMHVNVSDSECMGPKPQISRPCSKPPCFQMLSFSPHIKRDNFTFIQLKKSKTIRLRVGVKAILLPRQPVKIECPVENFDKSLLFWTKDRRLISTSVFSRVYVTHKGALKIRRTDPEVDTGIYTCMAGMESGSVVLEFQSKKLARQKAKKIKNKMHSKNENEIFHKPQADVIPGSGPQNIIQLPIKKQHSKKAVYITSEWSKCSRTCGTGFQTRKTTCNIVTDKYVKIVSDDQCHDKPTENQRVCTDNPLCPVWKTSDWSQCSVDKCQFEGLAKETREVHCGAENNNSAVLPIKKCDRNIRPVPHRQCPNEQCVAIWKTSKWTKCKPRCAKTGKKNRLLSCVWKHNKKNATDNCKSKPKPELRKLCRPKHCKRKCYDMSRYCSISKILRMCRYRTFKDRCCATCSNSVHT